MIHVLYGIAIRMSHVFWNGAIENLTRLPCRPSKICAQDDFEADSSGATLPCASVEPKAGTMLDQKSLTRFDYDARTGMIMC